MRVLRGWIRLRLAWAKALSSRNLSDHAAAANLQPIRDDQELAGSEMAPKSVDEGNDLGAHGWRP